MCDECAILREHYPRDPEVRLERVRLFSPGCIYCGARYIQWIQRKSGRPKPASASAGVCWSAGRRTTTTRPSCGRWRKKRGGRMSAMQRRKGAAAEREVLKLLGGELGQMLQRNLAQTRAGGADCLCVKGWAIEIKRQERLSRPTWWRQACEQAEREGVEPMLLYRRSREPWRALIHTHDNQYREGTLQDAASAIREKWLGWP